jgi:hypothetical protein
VRNVVFRTLNTTFATRDELLGGISTASPGCPVQLREQGEPWGAPRRRLPDRRRGSTDLHGSRGAEVTKHPVPVEEFSGGGVGDAFVHPTNGELPISQGLLEQMFGWRASRGHRTYADRRQGHE